MSQTILIDTDAGDDIDDLLAIAFALRRPELRVAAITTVSSYSARRAHLIRRLLAAAGRQDIEVAAGQELPLRALTSTQRTGPTDAYVANHAPPIDAKLEHDLLATDAVRTIIETTDRYPGELGIVTIGPLTNIACALSRRSDLAGKIQFVAAMGGELNLGRAEHNIAWDANAASIVLAAGIPVFLGTWDVTRRFTILPPEIDLLRSQNSPVCRLLGECIDLWWPHKGGKPGPVMYDLAPMLWSFDRSYFTTQAMDVCVETRGEFTCGMTIRGPGAPNADVTTDMRAEDVKALYLGTLLNVD